MLDEGQAVDRHAGGGAILGHPLVVGFPAHQLLAVVGEGVAADDTEVAGLELPHELREDARLEVTAVHPIWEAVAPALVGQPPPPGIRHPAQVKQGHLDSLTGPSPLGPRRAQPLARSADVGLGEAQRGLQRGVLAGRAQQQGFQQAEQGAAVALVGAPDEREVVAAGVGQVGLAGLEQLVPAPRRHRNDTKLSDATGLQNKLRGAWWRRGGPYRRVYVLPASLRPQVLEA
ncbi:MAG: hypothetical protein JO023_22845 [Chloroflexi bacterium]|nr:hypothetical protein [Chloroflexota bacterium]